MKKILFIIFISIFMLDAKEIIYLDLWPQKMPYDNGLSGKETGKGCIGNISKPTLTVYLPDKDKANGTAVVVIPGGGYGGVCMESEGENIAKILIEKGIAAIVLKYRLPNGHHQIPSADARRAIRTVRFNAEKWHIDAGKVGVWGFSAGGHLASTVTTAFDNGNPSAADPVEKFNCRPDFSILFYPVISMQKDITHMGSRNNLLGKNADPALVERYSNEKQITKDTPPVFMIHCSDDRVVNPENSIRFYQKLLEFGIPAELLLFEKGGHGPGAFKNNPSWKAAFFNWLKRRGCL